MILSRKNTLVKFPKWSAQKLFCHTKAMKDTEKSQNGQCTVTLLECHSFFLVYLRVWLDTGLEVID
jgi:hypothetical protein